MEFFFYILALIIFIFVVIISNLIKSNRAHKKLKKDIELQWGKAPETEYKDNDIRSISGYFKDLCGNGRDAFFIDNITWNDLDMDSVFKRINSTQSTIGEENLYNILRSPVFDASVLRDREQHIEYFRTNSAERAKLQMILAGLGKKRYTEAYGYFLGDSITYKYWRYVLQALALLLSPLVLLINFPFGFFAIVGLLVYNILIYYREKNRNEIYLNSLCYLVEMLRCSKRVVKANVPGINEYADRLRKSSGRIRSLSINSFYQLFYQTNDFMFLEPMKAMFLVELIAFGRLLRTVNKYREELHSIYKTIGLIDSMIAIASYRESLSFYTLPQLYRSNASKLASLAIKSVYHPLIRNVVTNSIDARRPVLITGSNASGKSTFLKTVAINTIFAQTIHTCLAEEYKACYFKVFTSMALRDDLKSNTSYYIAEINSLKRILDNLDDRIPLLCMVDEVLRGTNTIERIAASSEILRYFSESSSILIAATHDIELAEILKNQYDNYHFTEKYEGNEIKFEYTLHTGKSTTHNAIKLLKVIGYPENIVRNAENRAEEFLSEGNWKTV